VSDFTVGPGSYLGKCEWYGRPRRRSLRGGKNWEKTNTLNKAKKLNYWHNIKRNPINKCDFFTVHNSVRDGQRDNFAGAPKNLAMSLHNLQNFAHNSGTWKTQTALLSVSRQEQQRPSILSLLFQFKKGSRF